MTTHAATCMLAPYVFVAVMAAAPAFTTISKGDASDQEAPKQAVARTLVEWRSLWTAHSANEKLPAVDFGTKMVVGVFLGTKATTGYEVEVVNTREDGPALVIEYVVRQPRRDMMTAQILTQPYHLVAVAKHADPVRFVQVPDNSPAPPATLK
jgi:hypothetical protein